METCFLPSVPPSVPAATSTAPDSANLLDQPPASLLPLCPALLPATGICPYYTGDGAPRAPARQEGPPSVAVVASAPVCPSPLPRPALSAGLTRASRVAGRAIHDTRAAPAPGPERVVRSGRHRGTDEGLPLIRGSSAGRVGLTQVPRQQVGATRWGLRAASQQTSGKGFVVPVWL